MLCGSETENIEHHLFECTVARQVWALSEIPALALNMGSEDGFGWLQHISHDFDADLVLRIGVTFWLCGVIAIEFLQVNVRLFLEI